MGSLCSKVSVTPSLTVVNNSMGITTDYETIQVTNEFIPFDDRTSHISGNFILIWLNLNIDSSNSNIETYIPRLRTIINSIKIFHNLDECIDFITDLIDEKIFLIISGRITQQFASILHELIEIDSIYLFSNENSSYRQWIEQYQKIKGIFNEIDIICKILRRNVRYLNYNLTPISIISSSTSFNPNELDQSFMYSQLLKEIILDMSYSDSDDIKTELISFARSQYIGNDAQMRIIDEFEQEYKPSTASWWYTRDCFLHWMLNKALRTQNNEIIIKMGFFLRDLHNQIQHLYLIENNNHIEIVFRGQGVTQEEFNKIKQSKGGLLSFNNFLSTSFDSEVGYLYADSARQNCQLIGILFYITIDRSISSTPFASIQDLSYFGNAESEILFSMHTVFRIVEVTEIEDRLWQVNLTLTSDNDALLTCIMESIRKTITGNTPLYRLGNLMWYIGQYNEAEVIYERLLKTDTNINHREIYYIISRLCCMNIVKGDYEKVFSYFENVCQQCKEIDPSLYDMLSPMWSNFDVVDDSKEKHLALGYKILEMEENASSSNPPKLAIAYCSFGTNLQSMGEYSTALSFYEKSLEIFQKYLPINHPSLSIIYNNIGSIYHKVEEYLRALSYYEKTIQIAQRSRPSDHPDWVVFYHNIAQLYDTTGKHSMALIYYEKELKIHEKMFPSNAPKVINTYRKIGSVYYNMKAYSSAILSFNKGLEIAQRFLSFTDAIVATIYNEMGLTYQTIKQYPTALLYYEKALEILQKLLSSDHNDLVTIYSNIATVYQTMEQYSTSLLYYEKALEIMHKVFVPNHIGLTTLYNNIALVYQVMKRYSTAFLYYEKTLEICQKTLPSSYSVLFVTYINVGLLHMNRGKYSLAQSCFKNGLEVAQNSLSPTDPNLAMIYLNNGAMFLFMKKYSTALSYCERALEICQNSRSSNYPFLQEIYAIMGILYYLSGEYSKSRLYFEKTIEMHHLSISSNHPSRHINSQELVDNFQVLLSFNKLQTSIGKFLIRTSLSMMKNTYTLSSFMQPRINGSAIRINTKINAPIPISMHQRELII